MSYRLFVIVSIVLFVARDACADVVEYPPFGFHLWTADVGSYNTIDFTGFPADTFITDQYEDVGVTFTYTAFTHTTKTYSDEWGLVGFNGIRVVFDIPQQWIAVHFLGVIKFELSYQGEVFATTSTFQIGSNPRFAGIVSDHPFDEVYFFVPQPPFSSNVVSIDNLYWGAPIPAPGAIGMFALAALGRSRRCR